MNALATPRVALGPATGTDLLRKSADRLLVAAAAVWLIYNVNGLRPPWAPIVVNDADSGAAVRQLIFTAAALTALRRLFVTRSIGSVLVQHPGLVLLGGWLAGSVVYSADPTLTVKRAVIFSFGLLTLLTLVHLPVRPVRLMQMLVVGITVAAAWISIVGSFVLPANAVSIAERPGLAGVSGHPNTLAPAMVVGLLLSLGITPAPGWRKASLRAGQVGLLLALVMTNSITSFILLLAGLLVYGLLTVIPYRRGIIMIRHSPVAISSGSWCCTRGSRSRSSGKATAPSGTRVAAARSSEPGTRVSRTTPTSTCSWTWGSRASPS
jgi:hypothetical protein